MRTSKVIRVLVVTMVMVFVFNWLQTRMWTAQQDPRTNTPASNSQQEAGASVRAVCNTSHPFVYLALHKTGSTATTNAINYYCDQQHLNCLTASNCYQTSSAGLHPLRMALPLPLSVSENLSFIYKHVGHAATIFTLVRHPVDQFLSYWAYLKNSENLHNKIQFSSISHTVALCEDTSLEAHRRNVRLCFELVNSQSKELGWDGVSNESLASAHNNLRSLSAVGLYEQLHTSWRLFESCLGWPAETFWNNSDTSIPLLELDTSQGTRGSSLRQSLDPNLLHRIRQLQWADLRIYETAELLFEQQKSRLEQD